MASTRRHCRVISSSSLRPTSKPSNIQIEKEQDPKQEYLRVPRTTMNTEGGLKNLDEMTYSFSFEDNEKDPYEYEKQLFSKFLQSKQMEWMAVLSSMNQVKASQMTAIVKIGDNAQSIYDNRLIAHYIGIWLQSMGYSDQQNKQRIMGNVQLLFGQSSGVREVAELMYDNLFQGYLPSQLQMKALLEVCRRGWEYFTFLVCRLIRLLKKIKNVKNLYEQIDKAIDNV